MADHAYARDCQVAASLATQSRAQPAPALLHWPNLERRNHRGHRRCFAKDRECMGGRRRRCRNKRNASGRPSARFSVVRARGSPDTPAVGAKQGRVPTGHAAPCMSPPARLAASSARPRSRPSTRCSAFSRMQGTRHRQFFGPIRRPAKFASKSEPADPRRPPKRGPQVRPGLDGAEGVRSDG